MIIVLAALIIFQLIVIAALYADRIIYIYERGDDLGMLQLDNKVYDVLKWVAMIALPAISTFIVVISKIWGWPDMGSMIAQTVTAVALLLGSLLGISHISYRNDMEGDK